MHVVPTFATTLPPVRELPVDDWTRAGIVHLTEELEIYSPLLPKDSVRVDLRVVDLSAHSQGGVIVMTRSEARRERDERALFAVTSTWLARNADSTGLARHGRRDEWHPIPARPPDFVESVEVRHDQAALYRLCGDRNPLHIDTAAARAAGFEKPLLHGLCTFGIACRAVLKTVCDYDANLARSFSGRFVAPVFPGETLDVAMWQDGPVISYTVSASSGSRLVLDNGCCVLVA